MTTKKRGLGRGLNALLGASQAAMASEERSEELRNLPVDLIQRGKYQPRVDMHPDSLEDLASSIRAQGVVQPIVVRPLAAPGRYEIIAGERRWRAAQLAGLQEIPAVVRDVPDQAAIAMALIENIQRENLNPIEEASALQRLIDEFALTHQQAAEAVGRSRAAVSNLLRLLELPGEVRRMLEHGDLEMGHARALLGLSGTIQGEAARQVVAKGLSVRETEQLVRRLLAGPPSGKPAASKAVDPDIRRLQEDLAEKIGAKVDVQQGARGTGKLVIHYNSLDELDGILAHIK
ncbi:MAG: ParB/RepB/Spo0J family partition protein [Gammaproteobacteria bacterium]|nr:ParB/RepB/Spo0J family partition protein [Gammaproteobacteria bacterium]